MAPSAGHRRDHALHARLRAVAVHPPRRALKDQAFASVFTASRRESQRQAAPGPHCLPCSTNSRRSQPHRAGRNHSRHPIALNTSCVPWGRRSVMGTIGASGAKPVGFVRWDARRRSRGGLIGGLLGSSGFLWDVSGGHIGRSMLRVRRQHRSTLHANLLVMGAAAGIVRNPRDDRTGPSGWSGGDRWPRWRAAVAAARQNDPEVAMMSAGAAPGAVVVSKIIERGR